MTAIKKWMKSNIITTIAAIAAVITCFFVPIDKEYLNYFDYKTLICLSCILVSVQCLKDSGFFQFVSKKLIFIFKNTRSVVLALILLTFLCDLVLANDMSLITLLVISGDIYDKGFRATLHGDNLKINQLQHPCNECNVILH